MLDLDSLEEKAKAAPSYTDICDVMHAVCMGGDVWLDSEKGVTEFASAVNPAVVLELLRRLRASESIVYEVATPTPRTREAHAHNDTFDVCAYCGIDDVSSKVDRHRPTCLWRRAVEAKR